MKVDDEESFRGGDFLTTFVFFAFDAAVASGEFGAESVGDVVDVVRLFFYVSLSFSNLSYNHTHIHTGTEKVARVVSWTSIRS